MASGGLKIFTAGAAAAAAGVAALGTAAVNSYADYEQLVGGIETLFGAGGASIGEYADSVGKSVSEVRGEYDKLMEAQTIALNNANEAYKTAGLSANEYMETVTSFAASLKASTENEVEAAEAANSAVIDMADNANKMGTNMESIQNAYQGFAKQNYTMLDNLKLGYGGTKEEMERLLADAEKIHEETTGEVTHYDIDNLSDVYSAIHDVQTELGITGTTAKEASTTISGSVNAMKASWTNLVTGIADDNADFDTLINNFVESTATAAENILPRVEIALNGIGELIDSLLPVILDQIPTIINDVLPGLIESGINIVNSLINGIESNLPSLIQAAGDIINQLFSAFTEMFPSILSMGAEILSSLLSGIQGNLPSIVDGALSIMEQLITTIISMLPQIIETGLQIIIQLAYGIAEALPELIPQIVDVILVIVDTLINNIDLLVGAAVAIIVGLTEGILNALPQLVERIPDIVIAIGNALITNIPILLAALGDCFVSIMKTLDDLTGNVFTNLINGLKEFLERPGYYIGYAFGQLIVKIAKFLSDIADKVQTFFTVTIPQKWNSFIEWISGLPDKLISFFTSLPDRFLDIGENIISGMWNGIKGGWDWLTDQVTDLASGLLDGVKDALGIHSPSKEFAWIGKMCVAGFDDGMEDLGNMDGVQKNISASLDSMKANVVYSNSNYSAASYDGTYSGIDYHQMATEFADALDGMSVKLNNRQAGRILREALA